MGYPPSMFQLLSIPLLTAAPAPVADSIAGFYQSQQMEIGAALELGKNGHFRYQLDYGAVSESAEGNWTFDGKVVRLTTRPMPKVPSFELLRDDAAPAGELHVTLADPDLGLGGRLHAIVTLDGESEPVVVAADEQGRIDLKGKTASTLQPLMPITGTAGKPIKLSRERGHRLLFRFHANDFGQAGFDAEPLELKSGELLMRRYDAEIRFLRVQS
jgi:hypothetical protein